MASTTKTITLGRINPQPASIAAGGDMHLYCDARNADLHNSEQVIYLTSSDTSVAKVPASVLGRAPVSVSAIAPGRATITATASDVPSVTATFAVTVT